MKYRLVRRARGWAVQKCEPRLLATDKWIMWHTIAAHRFHWLASLHLWWLRERSRK